MLAEHLGLLIQSDPEYGTEAWREMTLLYGMMSLHTYRIMRLELMKAKADLARARLELIRGLRANGTETYVKEIIHCLS